MNKSMCLKHLNKLCVLFWLRASSIGVGLLSRWRDVEYLGQWMVIQWLGTFGKYNTLVWVPSLTEINGFSECFLF